MKPKFDLKSVVSNTIVKTVRNFSGFSMKFLLKRVRMPMQAQVFALAQETIMVIVSTEFGVKKSYETGQACSEPLSHGTLNALNIFI